MTASHPAPLNPTPLNPTPLNIAPLNIAQLNIGKLVAPIGDPRVVEFVDALDSINALGESSPGFVWRLKDEAGNATSIRAFDDHDIIPNLTVWTSVAELKAFAYRSEHVSFFKRRAEWFTPGDSATVLWWTRSGELPTMAEARRRVEFLAANGPSPYAFGFGSVAKPLVFHRAAIEDAAALGLIGELNIELRDRYPEPGANHFTLTADDVAPGAGALFVGTYDGEPVTSGAIRMIDAATAEVKRMYVRPAARGLKLGAAMLDRLHTEAASIGAKRMVLETGIRQPEADVVYRRAGYHVVPCWGEYLNSPATSVCMARDL